MLIPFWKNLGDDHICSPVFSTEESRTALILIYLHRVTVAARLFADRLRVSPTRWSAWLHGPIHHAAPMSIQLCTPEAHSSETGSPKTVAAAFN